MKYFPINQVCLARSVDWQRSRRDSLWSAQKNMKGKREKNTSLTLAQQPPWRRTRHRPFPGAHRPVRNQLPQKPSAFFFYRRFFRSCVLFTWCAGTRLARKRRPFFILNSLFLVEMSDILIIGVYQAPLFGLSWKSSCDMAAEIRSVPSPHFSTGCSRLADARELFE
jgi:hypothetical protein